MDRQEFVRLGILTEVALLVVAVILNGLWPVPVAENPLRTATGLTTLAAIVVGALAGLVMSGWFLFSWYSEFAPLRRIQEFVAEQLAPPLSHCPAWEVFALAAFAGIGEEVLFRGVLQPRIGWVLTTVLFGFAHAITPTYVLVAALLGGLLGQLQILTGNLWAPIVAHGVYDYIGFLLVIREYRAAQRTPPDHP